MRLFVHSSLQKIAESLSIKQPLKILAIRGVKNLGRAIMIYPSEIFICPLDPVFMGMGKTFPLWKGPFG
jgi:hypothetical protein